MIGRTALLMSLALTHMAWGEELPKGEALAKIVAEKCADGCAVSNAEDLKTLEAQLAMLTRQLRRMAREEGAQSCRIAYELPPYYGNREEAEGWHK